jgi:hypothetical protein
VLPKVTVSIVPAWLFEVPEVVVFDVPDMFDVLDEFDELHEANNIALTMIKLKANQIIFLFTFCLHLDFSQT